MGSCLGGSELGGTREVLNKRSLGNREFLPDSRRCCHNPIEGPRCRCLRQPKYLRKGASQGSGNPELGHDVSGHVLVNIVNNFLPKGLKEQADGH